MLCGQNVFQFAHIMERFAGGELAGGFNGLAAIGVPPNADGVEIFQRQPGRIQAVVAGGAHGLGTMDRQRLAQRGRMAGDGGFGILSGGMLGGGGGDGVPRMLSRINRPRLTGEVRVGLDVTARTLPMVSTPPRVLSAGSVT